jgi:hypothetical protein
MLGRSAFATSGHNVDAPRFTQMRNTHGFLFCNITQILPYTYLKLYWNPEQIYRHPLKTRQKLVDGVPCARNMPSAEYIPNCSIIKVISACVTRLHIPEGWLPNWHNLQNYYTGCYGSPRNKFNHQ